VADTNDSQTLWLSIIGRSLAYLCLSKVEEKESGKFDSVLKRVRFLEGLGLSRAEAAKAVGSSAESVSELHRRAKRRKAKKNGGAKKKSRR
jgi:hypothetical protein